MSTVQTPPVYSQTPRGVTTGSAIDFRLFADSISPDKSDFNTSSWLDGKDGVNADGINPETDRLTAGRWVIRGNVITFKVKGERNSRAVFVMNGVEQTSNAVSSNCTSGNNSIVNGLVVKFAELCDLSFSYTWTGTGAQNELGEALDYRNFQFYTIDLAGNNSAYSSSVMVWNDRTAPSNIFQTFESTDGNSVLGNVNSTDPNVRAITKSSNVKLETVGEQKVDVETELLRNGVSKTKRVQRAGEQTDKYGIKSSVSDKSNTRANAIFELSTNLTDERVGCTQLINGRNTGICDDGVYTFNTTEVDTSGNRSLVKTVNVERDTVKPIAPVVTYAQSGGILTPQIKYTITGEANTQIRFLINGKERNLNLTTGVKEYSITQDCGVDIVTQISLIDRAGNESIVTTKIVPAVACASCGVGQLLTPTNASITTGYGYSSAYFSGLSFHTGVDYSAAQGAPIFATESGIIKEIVITQDDDYVKTFEGIKCTNCKYGTSANRIVIDHGNGLTSSYYHLKYNSSSLKVGNYVSRGTQIGQIGTTGLSTGSHLHFEIKVNEKHQNPNTYLSGKGSSNNTGNLSSTEKSQFGCVPIRESNENDIVENPAPAVTTPPATGGSSDYDDSAPPDLTSPEFKCLKYSYFMEQGETPANMTNAEKLDCFGDGIESSKEVKFSAKETREILLKGDNPILNAVWNSTTDEQMMCILDSEGVPNAEGWAQVALSSTDTAINFVPVLGDLYSVGTGWLGYSIAGKMNCIEKWLSIAFGSAGITITVVGAIVTWYTGGTVGGVAGSVSTDVAKLSMKSILAGGGKALIKSMLKSSVKFLGKSIALSLGLMVLGGAIGFVIDQTGLLSIDTEKLEGLTEDEVEVLRNGENSIKPLATTATIIVGGAIVRAVRSQMWVSAAGIKIKLAAKSVSKFAHLDKLLTVGEMKLGSLLEKNTDITDQKNFWHMLFGNTSIDSSGGLKSGGGHMITALENGTVKMDAIYDTIGQRRVFVSQKEYIDYMKQNPEVAFKADISVKKTTNGVDTWVPKTKTDSTGMTFYQTHTFAPAGWTEEKFMNEMRVSFNKVDNSIFNSSIRTQGYVFNNEVKLLNISNGNKAYEISGLNGAKYRLVINEITRKVTTFFIN